MTKNGSSPTRAPAASRKLTSITYHDCLLLLFVMSSTMFSASTHSTRPDVVDLVVGAGGIGGTLGVRRSRPRPDSVTGGSTSPTEPESTPVRHDHCRRPRSATRAAPDGPEDPGPHRPLLRPGRDGCGSADGGAWPEWRWPAPWVSGFRWRRRTRRGRRTRRWRGKTRLLVRTRPKSSVIHDPRHAVAPPADPRRQRDVGSASQRPGGGRLSRRHRSSRAETTVPTRSDSTRSRATDEDSCSRVRVRCRHGDAENRLHSSGSVDLGAGPSGRAPRAPSGSPGIGLLVIGILARLGLRVCDHLADVLLTGEDRHEAVETERETHRAAARRSRTG